MKRLFFILSLIPYTLGIFSQRIEVDGIAYNIDGDKAKVTQAADYKGHIKVPNSILYNGKKLSVVGIDMYAFCNCAELQSVELAEGIEVIDDWAFFSCTSLSQISIPSSVHTIGARAMETCTSLTSIELPEGIENIEECTFEGCTSLEKIALPQSLTHINEGAFACCTALKSITLPQNVGHVYMGILHDCKNLTDIFVEANTPPAMHKNPNADPKITKICNTPTVNVHVPDGTVELYRQADGWMDMPLITSANGEKSTLEDAVIRVQGETTAKTSEENGKESKNDSTKSFPIIKYLGIGLFVGLGITWILRRRKKK